MNLWQRMRIYRTTPNEMPEANKGKWKALSCSLAFSKILRRFYLQLYNGSRWCCSASLPLPRPVLPGLSSSPVSSPPAIRPHHKYIKGISNIITLGSTLISVRVVLQRVLVPWTSVHVRGECTLKLFLLLCFNACMLVFWREIQPHLCQKLEGRGLLS